MAEALENAYLVLLAQIALILSAVMFGVPFFLSAPTTGFAYSKTTILFLAFIFLASSMMIANIIIGWAALKGSIKTPDNYTNKMFIVDVLIVLVFFFMNNAILFSFGGMLAIDKVSGLEALLRQGIGIHTVGFLSSALYALTATFLLLCKIWNKLFYRSSSTPQPRTYEAVLSVVIFSSIILSVLSGWHMNSFIVQASLVPIWIIGWMLVNGQWILLNIFDPPSSPVAVESGARAAEEPALAVAKPALEIALKGKVASKSNAAPPPRKTLPKAKPPNLSQEQSPPAARPKVDR